MKRFILYTLTAVLFSCSTNTVKEVNTEIIKESIDGPANIRDTINGKILFSINNNIPIECGQEKNNWHQVGLYIPLTQEQNSKGFIDSGTVIMENSDTICTILSEVSPWWVDEENGNYHGFIAGYTHKSNIKEETIPELSLMKILSTKEEFKYSDFEEYFKMFDFNDHGLTVDGYENLKNRMIYGAWIEDPSPIDRLRLMFLDDQLIAIVHERPLSMKNKKSYPLIRDLEILILKDFSESELEDFLEKNRESYNGVD